MGRGARPELILAAPWLARHEPRWFEGGLPRPDALSRLLGLARSRAGSPVDRGAAAPLRFFGLPARGGDLPLAALAYRGEGGDPAADYWLRADPVHLHPDMARLLLFAAPDIEVAREEAQELAAGAGELLADAGSLEVRAPARWYLRLRQPVRIETTPPADVCGEDIQRALPAGEEGAAWRRRLNEIQMVLAAHPVNQAREGQGRPTFNSVWFWGGGTMPEVPPSRLASVMSEEPVVRGLALAAGVPRVGAGQDFDAWWSNGVSPGRHLVWLPIDNPRAGRDPAGWAEWLGRVEDDWFDPLLNALRAGRIGRLILHPGDGRAWCVTAAARWCFWRRPRWPLPAAERGGP